MSLKLTRKSTLVLTLAGMLLTQLPAHAQSTKQRITTLEEKTQRLERLLENQQAVQTDLLTRLQQLQQENQDLRNQVETLQFESNRNGDRQRELYLDLDQRMQTLEANPGAVAGAGAAGAAAGAAKPSDAEVYQAAFNELRDGRYAEAANGFKAFLADYPDSELRGNAQYWLAESYYVQKDFSSALSGFQLVISDYPSSRKIADAWLKVGYCNYELDRMVEARQALTTAANQFPDSTASKLARERLTLMDASGQ